MCPNLRELACPVIKQHGIKSSLLSKGDKELMSILTNIPMSTRFFFSKKDYSAIVTPQGERVFTLFPSQLRK